MSNLFYNALRVLLFLKGEYEDASQLIKEINEHKKFHDTKIDDHHILILQYKIASTYLGNRDYENCIQELEKIVYHKTTSVRDDLSFNSRMLTLMAMLDSGLDENFENFMEESRRMQKKMKHGSPFYQLTLDLFQEIYDVFPDQRKVVAQKYLKIFQEMMETPYNTRSFVYLDIISWLESVIENRFIADIIQEKSN